MPMRYYPIFLDLRGRSCVVVGGGRVAERRVQALLRAGARMHVVSASLTPRLALLAAKKKIDLTPRAYRQGDLRVRAEGSRRAGPPLLVFAATDNPAAQEAIRKEAEAVGALVNIADDSTRSAFLVPASFRQGDLQVAISTSGASPALARALRRRFQETLGGEYRAYLRMLRAARRQVLKTVPNQEQRARVLCRLGAGLRELPRTTGARRAGAVISKFLAKFRNGPEREE